MNRRTFIRTGGAVIGAALVGGLGRWTFAENAAKRPNFVIVLADDMGYSDIGCFGSEIGTPNLDGLAKKGMRFTNFCNDAVCTASRACILTGLYSRETNHGDMIHAATFGEALKGGGYSTMYSGKWHVKGRPSQRGFDRTFALMGGLCSHHNFGKLSKEEQKTGVWQSPFEIDGVEEKNFQHPSGGYSSDIFTDYAIKFIKERDTARPFCLHLCLTAPHYPIQARAEDIARYRGKFMEGWDVMREKRLQRLAALGIISGKEPVSKRPKDVPAWSSLSQPEKERWDNIMAVYAGMVDRIDWNMGRLMGAMEQQGVADNTIFIFVSDNGAEASPTARHPDASAPIGSATTFYGAGKGWGWVSASPFNGFKGAAYKGGVGTPMIVYWPAGLRNPGSTCHDLGHFIDFMPTMLDLAGVEYPKEMNGAEVYPTSGISFRPLIEGGRRRQHDALYWGFHNLGVQAGRWKAIVPLAWMQINGMRSLSKNTAEEKIEFQKKMWVNADWHLFDLETDPLESENVAAKFPEKLLEMKNKWLEWSAACEKRLGAEYRPHPPSQIAL